MPARPSGEVKTRTVHVPQKNGDIYAVERQTIYIPEKKYNKVISSKLIAKIPKGEEIPVQTRQKNTVGRKNGIKTQKLSAQRLHVGMMDIIDHIGTVSGIDAGIYGSTDIGTAQKIISLARYLLATDGQSLPGILTWQYNHPLPYTQGLSETIYHNLFVQVGRDETLQQNFFKSRCEGLGKMSALAYDSTTDDAVYASTDVGTAQKIISLARYLLATNGQSLPGIQTWQFNHPLPYEDSTTEDIYHNLFVSVGLNENLQQNFFHKRCESLSAEDALAYDSSTISTYSGNQNEARYGFNKAHDGLKTIKLLFRVLCKS